MTQILVDFHHDKVALRQLEAMPEVRVVAVEPAEIVRALPDELIRDTAILLCTYPPANVAVMTQLQLVQISSVGYSQLYGLDLAERGVRACNARGVFDAPIAEWNVAMIINLLRDVRGLIRHQEHGIWDRGARYQREARGLTVGIWGYGCVGRATARLVKALGMKVHVMSLQGIEPRENIYSLPDTGDPDGTLPDRVFIQGQELEFLGGLDFLILAMPQTPANTGIIGVRELQALPPTAFVLNPARGPLIEEAALLRALREEWIAGAALDTHYYYPMPADHPLWRFPNVIMTPHISGSDQSPHFNTRVWDIFMQNVARWHHGQLLLNELTAGQLRGD